MKMSKSNEDNKNMNFEERALDAFEKLGIDYQKGFRLKPFIECVKYIKFVFERYKGGFYLYLYFKHFSWKLFNKYNISFTGSNRIKICQYK